MVDRSRGHSECATVAPESWRGTVAHARHHVCSVLIAVEQEEDKDLFHKGDRWQRSGKDLLLTGLTTESPYLI